MPAIWRSFEPSFVPDETREWLGRRMRQFGGLGVMAAAGALAAALATWSAQDPSFTHATKGVVRNALGWPGAAIADLLMQLAGLASVALLLPLAVWGWRRVLGIPLGRERLRALLWILGLAMAATHLAGGRDVVLPQFLGRLSEIERFEEVALANGAAFREVVLLADRPESLARFQRREDLTEWDVHNRALVARLGGEAFLARMYDQLQAVLAARPSAVVIHSEPDAIEATYAAVEAALRPRR